MDEKKNFRVTVPVEKCIQPEVPSSPRLLFRIFITVLLLTLTHPSRHKIFPEHPKKDAWVEIWHHHLEKVRTKLSENSKMFLIGQWEKELSRQMVNMPRAFQNHQSIAGCSKFFNLKPNAGTKNILQFQHAKIGKRFFGTSANIANIKGACSWEEKQKQKGIREMQSQSISFQNEKSP